MRRRRKAPTFAEAHEAVMCRFRQMTREDWLRSFEEVSHAPEGVEDPWPPYEPAFSKHAAESQSKTDPVEPLNDVNVDSGASLTIAQRSTR